MFTFEAALALLMSIPRSGQATFARGETRMTVIRFEGQVSYRCGGPAAMTHDDTLRGLAVRMVKGNNAPWIKVD